MKVLITGAHFTTAVATIEELIKQKDVEIVYVGRKTTREGDSSPSAESQIIPKLGIKFIPIITGRLQKDFTIYTIPSLFKIPIGLIQSFLIILREKPDAILSFGGYVAVPIVITGWLLSIPIIIHEQTLVSGLANTISSWFADKIAVSFKGENSFNKSKTVLTGNPLRREILNADKKDLTPDFNNIFSESLKNKLPIILITGGNQGSHVINLAVEEILDKLTKLACVIHQTGDSKFKDFERLSQKQNPRYLACKFIDKEMAYLLKTADLVVSRAGINTLTELAYFGTPTLVIPVPYLYKDEQNKNAKFFEKLGLVKILPQPKLSGNGLFENIKEMLKNIDHYKISAKAAKIVIIPDGAKRLSLETILLNKTSIH
jgi:UDP-N-acetylglucosamine--N-acetylmuramyl-(pentapeptide) pyrophosphoryl-undecaprenol N-acetylglucosamine transferase